MMNYISKCSKSNMVEVLYMRDYFTGVLRFWGVKMDTKKFDFEKMTREELLLFVNSLNESQNGSLGLVWDHEREPEKIVLDCNKKIPVLEQCNEKCIFTDKHMQNNILIEGDNFHSLSVLTYTHSESIDVIYIDPPYNTKSDYFIYNDKYVNDKDDYKHSKWLNFMEKRLRLARTLLKDDGCIMISINENELFVLKLLCDKIFDEKNYLTMFSVKVRHPDRILKGDKDFHEVTEFLLFYRKSEKFKVAKRKEPNTSIKDYKYDIELISDNPEYVQMGKKIVEVYKPGEYRIRTVKANHNALKKTSIRGSLKEGNSSGRFFMKYLNQDFEKHRGYLYKVPDMGADGLGFRYFTIPTANQKNGDYFQGVPLKSSDYKEFPYPNLLDFEADFNNVASEGGVEFRNGKKPIEFIKFLFTISGLENKPNAIVLDFFAGSGSTGHALLDYNMQFGGNRKFILCTNNEVSDTEAERFRKSHKLKLSEFEELKKNNDIIWSEFVYNNGICNSITYPRMKNVFSEYSANLLYFRTDFVSLEGTKDQLYYDMTEKCISMLNVKEDTHELVENTDEYSIFSNGEKTKMTCVYFDIYGERYDEFIKRIEEISEYKSLYIFTYGNDINKNDLLDVHNYKVEPIPYRILQLYKKIVLLSKGG